MTENPENSPDMNESEYILDFTTSSAISRITIKSLIFYIPILWLSGIAVTIYWYEWTKDFDNWSSLILKIIFLPVALFFMYFIFIIVCVGLTKMFLTLIHLIHKPRQGIFLAEKGNKDFEFWCLRIELKKLGIWLLRHCPFPWMDALAFRWFGLKIDFSSHLIDSWCDVDFVRFGRKVLVGQGAVVMSSMVVGKYLIIKEVIFDDYTVIGGQSVVSPGTIIGKDTILGAIGMTNFSQFLEPGWVYFGFPASKLKPNKYAESRRDVIRKVDVDDKKAYHVEHDVNIDGKKNQFKK